MASGNLLYDAGKSIMVLCDNLEGWDEVGGRFKREEAYGTVHGVLKICTWLSDWAGTHFVKGL